MSIVYAVRAVVTTANATGDRECTSVMVALDTKQRVRSTGEALRLFKWAEDVARDQVLADRPGHYVVNVELKNINQM